jgi:hypothetical protein
MRLADIVHDLVQRPRAGVRPEGLPPSIQPLLPCLYRHNVWEHLSAFSVGYGEVSARSALSPDAQHCLTETVFRVTTMDDRRQMFYDMGVVDFKVHRPPFGAPPELCIYRLSSLEGYRSTGSRVLAYLIKKHYAIATSPSGGFFSLMDCLAPRRILLALVEETRANRHNPKALGRLVVPWGTWSKNGGWAFVYYLVETLPPGPTLTHVKGLGVWERRLVYKCPNRPELETREHCGASPGARGPTTPGARGPASPEARGPLTPGVRGPTTPGATGKIG